MNSKTILGFLIAGSLSMVSCKKELQPQESPAPAEITAADAAQQVDPNATQLNAQAQPVSQQTPQAVPQPAVQQQPTTTAPGMNPPHGQPNHRCDIAVGAPLNSPPGQKPAATPQPQAQPQVQPQIQPQNTAATVTAPGMNPPHGQPGHKCEVAVGAPLPK